MFSSRDGNRGAFQHSKHDRSDRLRRQDDDSSRYGSGSDSYSTESSSNAPGKTTYDTNSSSYGSGRNADNDYSTSGSHGSGCLDNDSNATGNSNGSATNPRGCSSGSRNDSNSRSDWCILEN